MRRASGFRRKESFRASGWNADGSDDSSVAIYDSFRVTSRRGRQGRHRSRKGYCPAVQNLRPTAICEQYFQISGRRPACGVLLNELQQA